MAKQTYEAPTVTVLGSFEEMTKQATNGTRIDQTFPSGTPIEVVLENLS